MNTSKVVGILLLCVGAVLCWFGWRDGTTLSFSGGFDRSSGYLILGLVAAAAGVIALVTPGATPRLGYGRGAP